MSEPSTTIDAIDETNDESFPASDPPEWTGLHAGPPEGGTTRPIANLRTVRSAFLVDEAVDRVERTVRTTRPERRQVSKKTDK